MEEMFSAARTKTKKFIRVLVFEMIILLLSLVASFVASHYDFLGLVSKLGYEFAFFVYLLPAVFFSILFVFMYYLIVEWKRKPIRIQMNQIVEDDYASIIVINYEDIPLYGCYGRLDGNKIRFEGPGEKKMSYPLKTSQLSWSNRRTRVGDRYTITINPGNESAAMLDIAKAKNDELFITFANMKNAPFKQRGLYYVPVKIVGNKDEEQFETPTEEYRLNFRGGNHLTIEKVSMNSKKEKKDSNKKKLTRERFLQVLEKVSGPKVQEPKPTSDEEKKETWE